MKKEKLSAFVLAAVFFLCVIASQAVAQQFSLIKVVDTDTPIPGGSGNFTVFSYGTTPPYAVSGGNVAFQAGGESGQYGIYIFNGATLTKVADYNTPIPGGFGNFTIFKPSGPMISGNNVAFQGGGGSGRTGIYLFDGTILSVVADTNTPIPGGSGNFSLFSSGSPVISGNNVALIGCGAGWGVYLFDGNSLSKVADSNTPIPEVNYFPSVAISGGNVAFQAGFQDAIYLFNGTSLTKVADSNTPIPGRSENFSRFLTGPVISGNNVAFQGIGEGASGIYLFNGTTLTKVVDNNTPIPSGSENFTSFSYPAISGGNVVFQGSHDGGLDGIYLFNGTTLTKVADTNTPIPDGFGNFTSFSTPVISSGNVAFTAFGSGQQGIYLFNGTTLSKVADTNTPVPSGPGNFTGFFDPVIDDGIVVFGATGNGQQGFYLGTEIGLSVASPNGGETWTADSTQTIRWTYDGNPESLVTIELFKRGALNCTIASTSLGDGGSGSYDWSIPSTQVSGSDYQIKVTSTTNAAYTDTSDGNFTIVGPPLLAFSVTSPNGGESLPSGMTQTIRWDYAGNPRAYLKIELLKGGVLNKVITSFARTSTRSFNWRLPVTLTPGADYSIRITSRTNSAFTDTSDSNFTIAAPTVTLVSPNGGENWVPGTTQTIRWAYTGGPGAYLKIELLKGGILNRTITYLAVTNKGSFGWRIPALQVPGTDYSIRITSRANPSWTDTSDLDFTIGP